MAKKEPFSERLRRDVRECGMTRYAISKQTGIPECTLSRFVVGGSGLSMHNLDLLIEFLELELVAKSRRKASKKRAKKGGE
jgi:predicted transcriptional regulator